MTAAAEGGEPPTGDPLMARLGAVVMHDPEVFRALLETVLCLALPQEVLTRPGMRERIERTRPPRPGPLPGPGRAQLLRLLSA